MRTAWREVDGRNVLVVEDIHLCLRDKGSGFRQPCSLCDGVTDKVYPWAVFLMGDDPRAFVCDACADKADPNILKALEVLNDAEFAEMEARQAARWEADLAAGVVADPDISDDIPL